MSQMKNSKIKRIAVVLGCLLFLSFNIGQVAYGATKGESEVGVTFYNDEKKKSKDVNSPSNREQKNDTTSNQLVKRFLPSTGEKQQLYLIAIGVIVVMIGIVLWRKGKSHE